VAAADDCGGDLSMAGASPFFSVVVPTYNRRSMLERALRSVWAQTCDDYELIVVDDGSTDGTAEFLATLGSDVRTVRQENHGPSAARNAGARIARGDYLAFLDSDDTWFPWTLSNFAEALAEGSTSVLHACWLEIRGDTSVADMRAEPLRTARYDGYLDAGAKGDIHLAAGRIVVARTVFEEAGGFDIRLRCGEEHDLALRLGLAPGFIQVLAPYQVAYRRHPDCTSRDVGACARGASLIVAREKSGGYPGGPQRRGDREHIIARTVRPVSIACLVAGRWRDAWDLFSCILPWSLGQARWKYLLGFPALALGRGFATVFSRQHGA
jgi:hypothetical protein